jgi:catechol 2,3-dioxygenase
VKPGAVRLAVADLDGTRAFYERTIGLRPSEPVDEVTALGANGTPVVELLQSPQAPPRPAGTTGLFHLAILVPSRLELARSLRRVVRSGWSLTGASDHLVSEALYLSDPEGNGIEVYRDRPREEWRYAGGQLQMSTLPLDLQGLAAELGDGGEGEDGVAAGTRIGHVHLNVADLDQAERFYHGALGLDVTVRGYPGALFVASGAYHHHVGLNTWAGEGAPPPPPGTRGLCRFELVADDEAELERVERGLAETGVEGMRVGEGIETADPSGNRVLVRSE